MRVCDKGLGKSLKLPGLGLGRLARKCHLSYGDGMKMSQTSAKRGECPEEGSLCAHLGTSTEFTE